MLGISDIGLDFQAQNIILIFLLFLAAMGVAFFSYRRTNPPLSSGRRVLLMVLRSFAFFLLALAIAEPILFLARKLIRRPMVAMMVDDSASMGIEEGGIKRIDQVEELLAAGFHRAVQERYDLASYRFSNRVEPFNSLDSLGASGDGTALGGAIEEVRKQLSDEGLAAIVLFTDGQSNLGRDPVHLAGKSRIPLFTVGVGDPMPPRDVAITNLRVNQVAYVDNEVTAIITSRSTGYGGVRAPVILMEDGEELDRHVGILSESGEEQEMVLRLIPQEEGLHKYAVLIPLQEGELTGRNNRREFYLQVLKSKIRVLHLEGCPRWEFAFLRRALDDDPNVEGTYLVGKRGDGFYQGQLPQTREELDQYDLIVLGNCPRQRLGQVFESSLVEWVSRGGGLLMLAGENSFGRGGYAGSSMDDLVPVTLSTREQWVVESYSPSLTSAGRVHPITRLDESIEENEEVWRNLPPLLGVNVVGKAKPGAEVLVVHPSLKVPLIAIQRYGAGKTMALAASSTWRWDLPMWGIGKDNAAYRTFWSNIIRWLVTREESKLVRVTTDQKIYRAGQGVRFEAHIYDPSYQPVRGAEVWVEVREGKEVRRMVLAEAGGEGEYGGTMEGLPPGDYDYSADATLGGQRLGGDGGKFTVGEYSLEFEAVRMDRETLVKMAEVSGGAYYDIDEASSIPADLDLREFVVTREREIEFWDHPLLLGFIMLLLSAEWTLRKRSRLL